MTVGLDEHDAVRDGQDGGELLSRVLGMVSKA